MKLSASDRDAFVTAVMGDVPRIDYEGQAKDMVRAECVAKLPPKVRALWDDKELRGFVRCDSYQHVYGFTGSVAVPPVGYTMTAATTKKVKALADKHAAQRKQRDALRDKVKAVIQGCTTLKQARERLPEFAKYLPAERGSTGATDLPAVANVVADLTKAGWPKGKETSYGFL